MYCTCGHHQDRHNIEPAYPCYDCDCTVFFHQRKVEVGDNVLIPNGEGKPLSGEVMSIDSNNVATIRLNDVTFIDTIKCRDMRLL